ncbi:protein DETOXIFICATION 34-like [Vigna umbellata]|nr:protein DETOXIFICATION 34-like [Vigna umbellata]
MTPTPSSKQNYPTQMKTPQSKHRLNFHGPKSALQMHPFPNPNCAANKEPPNCAANKEPLFPSSLGEDEARLNTPIVISFNEGRREVSAVQNIANKHITSYCLDVDYSGFYKFFILVKVFIFLNLIWNDRIHNGRRCKKKGKEDRRENGGGRDSSSSSPENSPKKTPKSPGGETPLFNTVSSMDNTELHHAPEGLVDTNVDYTKMTSFADVRTVFSAESIKLWQIAGPIAFSILCNYGVNSFTSIFVGHLGDLELSAVSISLSVISNFSFGFLLGMASALETLCGQAFGAGQVEMLGIYMQRSWIILLGGCICLLPIYIYAEPILILLGQERDIAELAGVFTLQSIPQMFSLAINFPTQKFLQAQTKVGFLAWLGFVALILHVIILVLFMKVLAWGTGGAAAAYCTTAWIIALAQAAYVIGWCKDGWRGFSWLAFKDLWAFIKLSVASAIMLCLEVWYFMILIVLTGHLDNPVIAVGSLSICMNINGWEGMLFIGINAAISVRVSNELGLGRPVAAKYSVIVTIVESLVIGLLFAGIILITKDYFAVIFTASKEMIKAVSKLANLLGITMILNSVQPVISGVAVGGGWQYLVAYINLFCYYILGLPLGFFFGYKLGYRVEGIWIGMICGTALQTLILLIIVYRTNWNKEVEQASERMRQWTGQEMDTNTTCNEELVSLKSTTGYIEMVE